MIRVDGECTKHRTVNRGLHLESCVWLGLGTKNTVVKFMERLWVLINIK